MERVKSFSTFDGIHYTQLCMMVRVASLRLTTTASGIGPIYAWTGGRATAARREHHYIRCTMRTKQVKLDALGVNVKKEFTQVF